MLAQDPERVVGLTAKSLGDLTDKQLESEWTKKAKEFDRVKAELKSFSQEHQRRAAQDRARQMLSGLTDADRQSLLQEASTMGIESSENVKGTGN